MSKDFKELSARFLRSLKKTAKKLKSLEREVTKTEFFANDTEGFSEWEIRKAGGYAALLKLHFPEENDTPEIKAGTQLMNRHIGKMQKGIAEQKFIKDEVLALLDDTLKARPLKIHKPVTRKTSSKKKSKRTLIAAISDTHFGANISREELHGLNEFSWTTASRRLAHYIDQIVKYKTDHRKDTDLLIQLNGDIIAGQIHNQEWFVDLLTTQFVGTIDILSQAISYAAQHFPKVKVVCTPGNHGRNVGKADKGRATTHKWDSYENMIYEALARILANHPNVSFLIPESPYAVYKVLGHNIMQTHGDTVINVGNPGNSLNMGSITNQINNITSSDLLDLKEKIAVVSVGHVHTPTVQILANGASVIINGCLSGTDPFAQSIGIFSNNPTQVIFEVTEKYPVGDVRMVQLKSADKDSSLDQIIKPFKGKM